MGMDGRRIAWAAGLAEAESGEPGAENRFGLKPLGLGAEDAAELLSGFSILWVPFVGTSHAAEREVLSRFVGLLRTAESWRGQVWMYEGTVPLWPNRGVDVSSVAERKKEFLKTADGIDVATGLGRYRGLRPIVESAEGFLALDRKAFLCEARRWEIPGA